jgi:hypothetical protein
MICYDGTVRNSAGDVLQMLYGEDGMDGAAMERQVIKSFPHRQDISTFAYEMVWHPLVDAGYSEAVERRLQKDLQGRFVG